jgi:hypothetical protein
MKTYCISLCHQNIRIVRKSLERFYASKNPHCAVHHILVDQCYPLPDRYQVRKELEQISKEFGCQLLSPGQNLGLHKGWNWAMNQFPIADDDVWIGYDPDSYPITPGWDMALVTAIAYGGDVGWASLLNQPATWQVPQQGYRERQINQLRAWQVDRPAVNSVCAWRGDFLRRSGGLSEPMAFYGHLESAMWIHLGHMNLKWVFLPGWTEDERLKVEEDRVYQLYKWHHAITQKWPGSFEDFLRTDLSQWEDRPKS